tara:strand:- start:693 stop:1052 length:360 start_codon:yes stop_codon:yes gene_type:complete
VKSVVKYDLQDRLVRFSANVIIWVGAFKKNFASEHLSKQLIRSTTSAALNYGDAQGAGSKKDFIHKMKICLKELRESQINLEIIEASKLVSQISSFEVIKKECNELVAIFTSSIKTTTR